MLISMSFEPSTSSWKSAICVTLPANELDHWSIIFFKFRNLFQRFHAKIIPDREHRKLEAALGYCLAVSRSDKIS